MIVPIVIGAFGTKGLLKGLEDFEVGGRVKTIQPVEHESDHRTNCDWCFWYKGLLKGLEDFEVGGRVKTIQPVEHESDDRTNCDWCFWYKGLLKGLEDFEVGGTSEDHPTCGT